MTDQNTKRMGDYEVISILGSGGMGRVYQVRNAITDRVEAMKVLLPDLEGHEEVAARFLREIKLLAALKHPNIAALHTALTIDNQLVMVMEYVEGCSLSARLAKGPVPVPDALNYIDQVLDALSYAHQQNVIHRDIKPANMMLTPEGVMKLMDFGIARGSEEPAKLTATGTTLGSINYMSPEQVKGEPTDARSDLYSVGISLYEMVTGEKPFQGDSNFSIMAAHINEVPKPPVQLHPGLPDGLNEIILTAIAKSPAERFQSADAFRNAVRRVLLSLQDAKTIVQGSQNTIVADTAARNAYLRTASIGAAKTPVPTATPAPPVPAPVAVQPSSGHRGLYIALGAFIVLAVLLAAGIYMPSRKKSSVAAETATNQPIATTQAQPEVAPPTPLPPQQMAATESNETSVTSEEKSAVAPAKKLAAKNLGPASQVPLPPDNSKAEAAAKAAELDALEHQIDQLFSRASAVNSSLDRLQQEQARMGLGLRGDISAKQASMKDNLAKAQSALEHNDAERAKRFASKVEPDVEALEKFLGR